MSLSTSILSSLPERFIYHNDFCTCPNALHRQFGLVVALCLGYFPQGRGWVTAHTHPFSSRDRSPFRRLAGRRLQLRTRVALRCHTFAVGQLLDQLPSKSWNLDQVRWFLDISSSACPVFLYACATEVAYIFTWQGGQRKIKLTQYLR